jgi:hypothetical protein
MQKITFILMLSSMIFFDCNQHTSPFKPDSNMEKGLVDGKDTVAKKVKSGNAITYKFDSNAAVNGCSNVLLQKISKDLQYELMISLAFDSIPKFKEIDISKYSQFISIYLNKYPPGNNYVHGVCDDVIYGTSKPPVVYSAISGSLTISFWSETEAVVSVSTKDLVLKNKSGDEINIPFEFFSKLHVHWIGG